MLRIRVQTFITKTGKTTAIPVMDMTRHQLRQLRGKLYNRQRKGDDTHATELQLHAVNSVLLHKFGETTKNGRRNV